MRTTHFDFYKGWLEILTLTTHSMKQKKRFWNKMYANDDLSSNSDLLQRSDRTRFRGRSDLDCILVLYHHSTHRTFKKGWINFEHPPNWLWCGLGPRSSQVKSWVNSRTLEHTRPTTNHLSLLLWPPNWTMPRPWTVVECRWNEKRTEQRNTSTYLVFRNFFIFSLSFREWDA